MAEPLYYIFNIVWTWKVNYNKDSRHVSLTTDSLCKFRCFLCEWYSIDRKRHYNQKQWPKGETLIARHKDAVHTPLIHPEKVYVPPLHIKLGLIQNFFKAMYHNSAGFMYLINKFPRIKWR
jgi:hypothetical protein